MNDKCLDSHSRSRCQWKPMQVLHTLLFRILTRFGWSCPTLSSQLYRSTFAVDRRHNSALLRSVCPGSLDSVLFDLGSSTPLALLSQLESISDGPARLAPLCWSSPTHTKLPRRTQLGRCYLCRSPYCSGDYWGVLHGLLPHRASSKPTHRRGNSTHPWPDKQHGSQLLSG